MKFREHRGGYSDSMATMVEFTDRAALVALIQVLLQPFHFEVFDSGLHVESYGTGIDPRNGWDTHIVTLDGYGVLGFTDGPMPKDAA